MSQLCCGHQGLHGHRYRGQQRSQRHLHRTHRRLLLRSGWALIDRTSSRRLVSTRPTHLRRPVSRPHSPRQQPSCRCCSHPKSRSSDDSDSDSDTDSDSSSGPYKLDQSSSGGNRSCVRIGQTRGKAQDSRERRHISGTTQRRLRVCPSRSPRKESRSEADSGVGAAASEGGGHVLGQIQQAIFGACKHVL